MRCRPDHLGGASVAEKSDGFIIILQSPTLDAVEMFERFARCWRGKSHNLGDSRTQESRSSRTRSIAHHPVWC